MDTPVSIRSRRPAERRVTVAARAALTALLLSFNTAAGAAQVVHALFIPLADHYAALVAYEKYRGRMQHADFRLERVNGPWLVRTRFADPDVDMAFEVAPMAMDMFLEQPDFRWIGLMHRDGNALAVNDLLDQFIRLPDQRSQRRPNRRVAEGLRQARKLRGHPLEIGLPHPQATHTAVLYKFLKDHDLSMGVEYGPDKDVVTVRVSPPEAPRFIKRQGSRGVPSGFEQSLPWADVAEQMGLGRIAWYSKDVVRWPRGHVECIILAKDNAIAEKRAAVAEVVRYIHQAGIDIEAARREGGAPLDEIIAMIRRHIPEHTPRAIRESLRPDLNVINYHHLNVDKGGLRQIMDLSVEAGIIPAPVDIDAFADESFATDITDAEPASVSPARPAGSDSHE